MAVQLAGDPRIDASRGLEAFLGECRLLLDDALDRAVPLIGIPPMALHEAMRYTLLLPGKRLRGVLALAACDILMGEREDAVPLACAVEVVHASSLIFDDLPSMDNATLRRGKPTLHRVVGEANAILAAVALLNTAFAIVNGAPRLNARVRRAAIGRLTEAVGVQGLIGGQMADLSATDQRLDFEMLECVHSRKTGPLFLAAADLGSLVAGANAREAEGLHRYAKNLGLAFQITDDILNYGNPETTGKDAALDHDRTTFVNLCGIDGAKQLVEELIGTATESLTLFGRRATILRSMAEFVRNRDR